MRHDRRRRGLAPLAGAALLALVAGCSATADVTGPLPAAPRAGAPSPPHGAALTWIIQRQSVAALRSAGMSAAQMAELFDNSHTYLVGAYTPGAASGGTGKWISTRTLSVTDLRAADFSPAEGAVLYDDEDWSLTPRPQQRNPAHYETRGLALAHAQGEQFIAAPALDLVRVLDPAATDLPQAFLTLDVIGQAARHADAVDIQAQSLEGTPQYATFVQAAARQAKAANPNVLVLAGISTNPDGRPVTPQTLTQDATAVRPAVDGYWLNIPSAGAACPSCGTADPQAAVPWLEGLAGG